MNNWMESYGNERTRSAVGLAALVGTVLLFFSPWWTEGPRFWEDALMHDWPSQSILAGLYAQGRLPLWDPYSYGGDAWLGSPIRGVFYPVFLLLVPIMRLFNATSLDATGYGMWVIAHYLFAAIGGYRLGRQCRLGNWGGFVIGVGYALGLTTVARFKAFTYLIGLAWLPLLAWLAMRLAENSSWRRAGILGLALGSVFLGTSPQHGFFVGMGVFLVFLFVPSSVKTNGRGRWLKFSIAVAIAVAMACSSLLYQFEYAKFCGRLDEPFRWIDGGASPWWVAGRAFYPILTGLYYPGTEWTWITWGDSREAPYTWCYEEAFFPGLTVWTGGFLYLWNRGWKERRSWPWLALFIFGILWSQFEFNPLRIGIRWLLMPLATARCPARGWCLTQLGLVILAVYGYRSFFDESPSRRLVGKSLGTLLACYLVSVGIGLWRARVLPPEIANPSAMEKLRLIVIAVVFAQILVIATIAWALRKPPPNRESPWVEIHGRTILTLILCAELFGFGIGALQDRIRPYQPASFYTMSPELAEVRQKVSQQHQRFDGWRTFEVNLRGALMRIPNLQGYSNIKLPMTGEAFVGGSFEPRSPASERRLDLYGTAWAMRQTATGQPVIVSRPRAFPKAWFCAQSRHTPLPDTFRSIDDPQVDLRQVVFLPPNDDPPAVVPPSIPAHANGVVEVQRYGDNEVLLKSVAPIPGWVVINDHDAPGWNCSIDGQPARIHRADVIFRAVAVTEGSHRIRFWFWPRSLSCGLIVAGLGILTGMGLIVLGSGKRGSA